MTDDLITYAIGDVHGCLSKLVTVVETCRRHADGRPSKIVTLGDYIDRGPDSRGVIEYLRGWDGPERLVCIKGNHEEMLVAALKNPDYNAAAWRTNGGENTLWSFGAMHPHQIPHDVSAWMEALPLSHDDGLRLFVHAGVDPTRPWNDQRDADLLLWRREYPDDMDTGRYIVHGHTPQNGRLPVPRPHRINLDLGACGSGPLAAAVFDAHQAMPIAVIADDVIVEIGHSATLSRLDSF